MQKSWGPNIIEGLNAKLQQNFNSKEEAFMTLARMERKKGQIEMNFHSESDYDYEQSLNMCKGVQTQLGKAKEMLDQKLRALR